MKDSALTSPTAAHGLATRAEGPLLDELLQRWEELRERGWSVTATDLAGDHPELIDTLRRRIHALEAMDAVLNASDSMSRARSNSPNEIKLTKRCLWFPTPAAKHHESSWLRNSGRAWSGRHGGGVQGTAGRS